MELREEIVKKLRRDNHVDANVSQIMVTVGAIEGLAAAVMAVVDPGDEVIVPSPTYLTHVRQIVIASAKPVFVPLIEEQGYLLGMQRIKDAITPTTKAILFCTPNNPTGTVVAERQLRELAEIALKNNLMVITDEDVIPQINKAHIPFAICAPVVSQYAALAALRGSQDCVKQFRDHYQSTRDLMCERLDRLDSVFAYEKPRGSYLMFPRILLEEGKDSTTFCKKLLREGGVSTTPGIAFGPTGQGHLRMSFCVPEEEIDKAFDKMKSYYG